MTSLTVPTADRVVSATDTVDHARRKVRDWLDATLPAWWPDGPREDVEPLWCIEYFRAGLATPCWPAELGGLGLPEATARVVNAELVARDAPVPYNLVTVHMIGEVLLEMGTEEQQHRLMPPLATRRETWCQLFSEPGAGSDLASLACRAEPHDGSWVVNGQKVWSSFALDAARGLLLARTDPLLPKQEGITAFAVDMSTPGIDVRPLRQMTGDSQFCEVFFDDVVVPDSDRIGRRNRGWAVARAMLAAERSMLGGQGASPVARVGGVDVDTLLACIAGAHPGARDQILRFLVNERVIAVLGARLHGDSDRASIVKLAQAEHNQGLQSLAVNVIGLSVIAHEHDDRTAAGVAWGFLRSRANTLGGGTSEIMRTVIGERLLGLPREPDPHRGKPWSEVPRS